MNNGLWCGIKTYVKIIEESADLSLETRLSCSDKSDYRSGIPSMGEFGQQSYTAASHQ